VRTRFEFDFVTTATPAQVVELMIDFSPNRPHRWPASSVQAFEVYRIGNTDADIREGQNFPKLWAKWHYDWSEPNSVVLSVAESDDLEAGGFMSLTAAHREGGSAPDAVPWAPFAVDLLQEGLRQPLSPLRPLKLFDHLRDLPNLVDV
jgi:hypothetical protein